MRRWLTACTLAAATLAAGPSGARAPDGLDALAGRYGRHYQNGDMAGHEFWSDNVVEIVPVRADAAYIRVELVFFNGHMCTIHGVGQYAAGQITYKEAEDPSPDATHCTLTIGRKGNDLLLDDGGGSCSTSCGARGTLSGQTLPFSSRRPITYMRRLKASEQYQAALKEWRAGGKR